MITFNRSQIIGAEFTGEDTVRFQGIQEDHIYGMEITMDVRVSTGEILSITGNMKRYTNFVCPQAIPILQTAVGMSLQERGWANRIMREIGRLGCEHFAEIIIECGRCLDQARLARKLYLEMGRNPEMDQESFVREQMKAPSEIEST
jgi:hypothetical protein